LNKYDRLFGIAVKPWVMSLFPELNENLIVFANDADCFMMGHGWKKLSEKYRRLVGVTLGTGFGSSFMEDGKIISNLRPETSFYYNHDIKGKWADDYFSTRWFISRWKELTREEHNGVKSILQSDKKDLINQLFKEFSDNLSEFLVNEFKNFAPDCFVIGGSIANGSDFFLPNLQKNLIDNGFNIEIIIDLDSESTALRGAVSELDRLTQVKFAKRKTLQYLIPKNKLPNDEGKYDIYPTFKMMEDQIYPLFGNTFLSTIRKYKNIIIDGYVGVFWNDIVANIVYYLKNNGYKHINVFDINTALKPENEINEMLGAWLGGNDPVFGKIYPGNVEDYFVKETMSMLSPIDEDENVNIIFGCGSSLAGWRGLNMYIDIPKNEIQFRMRSGACFNLGVTKVNDTKQTYKRFYFVDWIVLNRLKCRILPNIDMIVDGQRIEPDNLVWMYGNDFRSSLEEMSKNTFRVRPWFEPGIWGGQWIKNNIDKLNQEVVNYAWSFELIVPENGILFESSQIVLETSFDFLMFHQYKNVLGLASDRFVYEFPIRFDFLDTFDGENLSVQCHPKESYMKEQFGETFTQDESYYILECDNHSEVYLGFQEDINPQVFKNDLEKSFREGTPVEIEKYVQMHPSSKHDLFLIPAGTVHCSGINNLVLEISSTPYIYTFKMYDWLRLDLDGKPRPLNIERAFHNLEFSRKGQKVKDEHISKTTLIEKGDDWELLKLSSHEELFYTVDRVAFMMDFSYSTNNKCLVCSLVEGKCIEVFTGNRSIIINYAETFVIPASADHFKFKNKTDCKAHVIMAYVKPEKC
jgi:mannose-6-phosphate isomerase class I